MMYPPAAPTPPRQPAPRIWSSSPPFSWSADPYRLLNSPSERLGLASAIAENKSPESHHHQRLRGPKGPVISLGGVITDTTREKFERPRREVEERRNSNLKGVNIDITPGGEVPSDEIYERISSSNATTRTVPDRRSIPHGAARGLRPLRPATTSSPKKRKKEETTNHGAIGVLCRTYNFSKYHAEVRRLDNNHRLLQETLSKTAGSPHPRSPTRKRFLPPRHNRYGEFVRLKGRRQKWPRPR